MRQFSTGRVSEEGSDRGRSAVHLATPPTSSHPMSHLISCYITSSWPPPPHLLSSHHFPLLFSSTQRCSPRYPPHLLFSPLLSSPLSSHHSPLLSPLSSHHSPLTTLLSHFLSFDTALFTSHYEQSEIWVGKEADVGAQLSVPSVRGDKVTTSPL